MSAPTCTVDLSGFPHFDSGCVLEWAQFALARAAHRFVFGSLNGPGGNNLDGPNWLWSESSVHENTGRLGDLVAGDLDLQLVAASNPVLFGCSGPRTLPNGILDPSTGRELDLYQDRDWDLIPDACDNCLDVPNRLQRNCNEFDEAALNLPPQGNACDPVPCPLIEPMTNARPYVPGGGAFAPGVVGFPGFCPHQGSPPNLPIRVRPFGFPVQPLPVAPEAQITPNGIGLARCVCATRAGTISDPTDCAIAPCARTGLVGQAATQTGWFAADVSQYEVPCALGADGRCLPFSHQEYHAEVTSATLAAARSGREADSDFFTPFTWRWQAENGRSALMPPGVPYSTSGALPVYLWARGSRSSPTTDVIPPATTAVTTNDYFLPAPLYLTPPQDTQCTPQLLPPIPFWEWQPYLFVPSPTNVWSNPLGGRTFAVVGVPAAQVSSYPLLGGGGGDLAAVYGALGVGVYEPLAGRWSAVGSSTGDLPPVDGTAFAFATGADGNAHIIGVGGDTTSGPSGWLYDGSISSVGGVTNIQWTRHSILENPDVGVEPDARSHSAVAASPDGTVLYLFGGVSPKGVTGDLMRYDVLAGTWSTIDLPSGFAARTDASMAFDGDQLVVFGGQDANQAPLGDLLLVNTHSRAIANFGPVLTPRTGAAVVLDADRAYVYGGSTANGATDEIDLVPLTQSAAIQSANLGVASDHGAGIGLDASRTLYIIPGHVADPTYAGTVFAFGASLTPLVLTGGTLDAITCNGIAAPNLGLPCQTGTDWTRVPGVFACGTSQVVCVAPNSATSGVFELQGDRVAVGAGDFAVSSGTSLSVAIPASSPTVLAQTTLPSAPDALAAMGDQWVVATATTLALLDSSSANGPLAPLAQIQTCGNVKSLHAADGMLLADTTVGVERFVLQSGTWSRGDITPILEPSAGGTGSDVDQAWVHTAHSDADWATLCTGWSTQQCGVDGTQCTSAHAPLEVTDDNVIWVTRGTTVYAVGVETTGWSARLASLAMGSGTLSIRAMGTNLATVSASSQSVAQTLAWTASDEAPPSADDGALTQRGAHGMGSWVTDHPEIVGGYVLRFSAGTLDAATLLSH